MSINGIEKLRRSKTPKEFYDYYEMGDDYVHGFEVSFEGGTLKHGEYEGYYPCEAPAIKGFYFKGKEHGAFCHYTLSLGIETREFWMKGKPVDGFPFLKPLAKRRPPFTSRIEALEM